MTFFKIVEGASLLIAIVVAFLFIAALGTAAIVPIAFMIPYMLIGLIGFTIKHNSKSLGNRTIGAGVEISSILANIFYLFTAINVYSLKDNPEQSFSFLTFLILWASTAVVILIISYIIGYVKEKNEIVINTPKV